MQTIFNSVPPSFWDAGAWERGNAHWGRVETPQNFGVFWGTGVLALRMYPGCERVDPEVTTKPL